MNEIHAVDTMVEGMSKLIQQFAHEVLELIAIAERDGNTVSVPVWAFERFGRRAIEIAAEYQSVLDTVSASFDAELSIWATADPANDSARYTS